MTRYAVGLGSNLGDRLTFLRAAIEGLAGVGAVAAVSPLYETDPVGGPAQGRYLNAVVVIDSGLDAHAMLEACHRLETQSGRVRDEHWGPRTLDMDLITSDGPPIDDERLRLPHPRASERVFVLRPLVDVWPGAPVGHGVSASAALATIDPQGVSLIESDWV